MLMRYHDRVQILGFLTDLSQSPRQFPHAETSIYQNAGF
jgi:hypothetical protein